jgi:hypothetical protein
MADLGYALGEGAQAFTQAFQPTMQYKLAKMQSEFQMGLEAKKMELEQQSAALNAQAMSQQIAESALNQKLAKMKLNQAEDLQSTLDEMWKLESEKTAGEGAKITMSEAQRRQRMSFLGKRLARMRGESPEALAAEQGLTAAQTEEAQARSWRYRNEPLVRPDLNMPNVQYLDKELSRLEAIPEENLTASQKKKLDRLREAWSGAATSKPTGVIPYEQLSGAQQTTVSERYRKAKETWENIDTGDPNNFNQRTGQLVNPFPYANPKDWYNAINSLYSESIGGLDQGSGVLETGLPSNDTTSIARQRGWIGQ